MIFFTFKEDYEEKSCSGGSTFKGGYESLKGVEIKIAGVPGNEMQSFDPGAGQLYILYGRLNVHKSTKV